MEYRYLYKSKIGPLTLVSDGIDFTDILFPSDINISNSESDNL